MQINNIWIKEFGKLRDFGVELSNGVTVIEGDNESGKSTLLAFIKFVLFGLPRRAAGETLSERDRWLSWDNGIAEGSMDITVPQGRFRIERKGQLYGNTKGTYTENARIINLATGLEEFKGEVPGRIFLGITPEVFTSTSCIRQLECTRVSGDDISSSIENLMFSADEEVDTGKAQSKLSELRKALYHKNGRGGLLFDLENEAELLRTRLEKASENADAIISIEARIEKLKETTAELNAVIERDRKGMEIYNNCHVLKQFDSLHSYNEKLEELSLSLTRLAEESGFSGKLPSREALLEIDSALLELSDAIQKDAISAAELVKAESTACGDRDLSSRSESIAAKGGKESILAKFKSFSAKRSAYKTFGAILTVLAVIFGAFGVASLLLESLSTLIPIANASYFAMAGGVLLLVAGISLLISSSRLSKKRSALLLGLGAESVSMTATELADFIDECNDNRALCERHDDEVTSARAKRAYAESMLTNAISRANAILKSFDRADLDGKDSAESVASSLRELYAELLDTCGKREVLEREMAKYKSITDAAALSLEKYNEQELRASIGTRSADEWLGHLDVDKLNAEYECSVAAKEANEKKRIDLEKELVGLKAISETPARVACKLAEVKKRLADGKAKYDAIIMAFDAIGEASEKLRNSVTPQLRMRASEIMGMITDKKYSDLGISSDMKVTAFANHTTHPIDALSKGTRDAAYISLRMALVEMICGENPPPLTFDETFSMIDETRTATILNMLYSYTMKGGQCIIFTCHKREAEMLSRLGRFNHIKL